MGASLGKGIQALKRGLSEATSTEEVPPSAPRPEALGQPREGGAPKRLSD